MPNTPLIGWPPAVAPLWALACCLVLLACGESDRGPSAVEEFEPVVGLWDIERSSFQALESGDPVDVIMGFQGLVFVNLALLADREVPARFVAEGEIIFDDLDERYRFFDNQVLFEPLGDDHRVVPSLRVPFSLPSSQMDGREVRLELMFESHDETWRGTLSHVFVIVDRNCFHRPNGDYVCDE